MEAAALALAPVRLAPGFAVGSAYVSDRRYMALDLALNYASATQLGDDVEKIVTIAERFLSFLNPPDNDDDASAK